MKCVPQRCVGITTQAAAIDGRVAALHRVLFVEPNPIPVKWAVHRMGLIGEALRLPLVPLTAGKRGEVEAAMRAAGVLAG